MLIYNSEDHIKGYSILRFDLLPGWNYVEKELWEKAKKTYPMIKEELEGKKILSEFSEKVIKEIEDAKGNKKQKEVTIFEFSDASNETCKELLNETFSIKTLEKLRELDTRSDIRYNIEQRIDFVKKPEKKGK